MHANTEPSAFTGWHRPHARSPWWPVVRGDSEGACWASLLTEICGGDKIVLAAGRDPNHRASGTQARSAT